MSIDTQIQQIIQLAAKETTFTSEQMSQFVTLQREVAQKEVELENIARRYDALSKENNALVARAADAEMRAKMAKDDIENLKRNLSLQSEHQFQKAFYEKRGDEFKELITSMFRNTMYRETLTTHHPLRGGQNLYQGGGQINPDFLQQATDTRTKGEE